MIKYRLATEEDVEELVKLRIEFLHEAEEIDPSTPSDVLRSNLTNYFQTRLLDGSFITWLATTSEKIVGTSGMLFQTYPPFFGNPTGEEAYIMNMYTLQEHRGKGIGTTLLEKLIEEASNRKITRIRLHATDIGRAIYGKRGFEDTNSEMILKLD